MKSKTGIGHISGGLDFYALMGQPDRKEFSSIFSGAMATFSTQTGAKLVYSVDFGHFKRIADLGGSRETFLAQILEYYPTIEHGIVFDLPHIINLFNNSDEFLSRQIPKDRWTFLQGDLFDLGTFLKQFE